MGHAKGAPQGASFGFPVRRRDAAGRCQPAGGRVAVLETRCVYSEDAEDHALEAVEDFGVVHVVESDRLDPAR
jgi:hypothetical protein